MHLAAESYVDRSIDSTGDFIQTNIVGTYSLLEVACAYWQGLPRDRNQRFPFHHVSTDEVYGDLGRGMSALFREDTPYAPSTPYAASKAAIEQKNLTVVQAICDLLEELAPGRRPQQLRHYRDLITFVTDRPGHDGRYATDASKIERALGWRPRESFESGLRKTVHWYLDNEAWCHRILTGAYRLARRRASRP